MKRSKRGNVEWMKRASVFANALVILFFLREVCRDSFSRGYIRKRNWPGTFEKKYQHCINGNGRTAMPMRPANGRSYGFMANVTSVVLSRVLPGSVWRETPNAVCETKVDLCD